ncbi:MAG: MarR family transcriptional regulator [Hyphomicrobium sp.]|nr:MarR family transcriptional regulator [Hyphomicrobium sp.]MBN9276626.1 MarR family transcriptional regulator [Hyphomicrobium sp.]OJU25740.1 MAG: MarR family transcriptional regulator [Alphaproteobacteria bacterium 64-6]
MSSKPSEITIRAWARLMRAQQLVLASIERDLKVARLPPLVWYDVLLEVERAGEAGLRPFELERAMLLAQYNLSRLIDRIEHAGYVERRSCEDDGRGQLVAITDRGKAIRRKMWPVYARAIEAAVGRHLSPKQAEALDDLLGLLIERHRQ